MRALDRLLLNPYVQRLGGVQALAGALALAWGLVKGVDPLIVVGGLLCAANLALFVFWPKVKRHLAAGASPAVGAKFGPAERRERLDNLLYPPRDDQRELGQQCAFFAMKMRFFNEEQEWKRERTIARFAKENREADPDLDPLQARKDAENHFERNVEAAYGFEMREEAVRLFDEARQHGAIEARARRVAERPLAVEMAEVPNLFVVLARRLDPEGMETRPSPPIPPSPDLADRLDAFMREGMDLVDELSVPVAPEKIEGGWKLEGGDAPDDWWDKADDFTKRVRKVLVEHHPALLTDYRDGYNAHVKKEGEEHSKADPAQDKRSNAEKMLALANFERSGPKRVVEASLEGLAAARHVLI